MLEKFVPYIVSARVINMFKVIKIYIKDRKGIAVTEGPAYFLFDYRIEMAPVYKAGEGIGD